MTNVEKGRQDLAFSVVIPLFNEEENVAILHKELTSALDGYKYELIYVDDGSTDSTLPKLRKEVNSSSFLSNAKIISFPRNIGQSFAFKIGVDNASFDTIIFIDGDLQNDPRDIPKLLDKFQEGYDLVQGIRVGRKDPFFLKRLPSKIANIVLRFLCGSRFHDLGCSLRIFSKKFTNGLDFYQGFHRMLPIYFTLKGARATEVKVSHRKRRFGKTKYGFSRTIEVLFEIVKINFLEKMSNNFIYLTLAMGCILVAMGFFFLVAQFIIDINLRFFLSFFSFTLGLYIFVIAAMLYIIRSFYSYHKERKDFSGVFYGVTDYGQKRAV